MDNRHVEQARLREDLGLSQAMGDRYRPVIVPLKDQKVGGLDRLRDISGEAGLPWQSNRCGATGVDFVRMRMRLRSFNKLCPHRR